ncbi:MAG: grasp-with-spasm system ATP-grasp peptide maturase [Bacteroidota bacterium]
MLLILSEETDITTDIVCNWLNHMGTRYLRINQQNNVNLFDEIQIRSDYADIRFIYNNKDYSIHEFEMVWFRRGYFNISDFPFCPEIPENTVKAMCAHFYDQRTTLLDYIYEQFTELPHINDPKVYNINKLSVLRAAAQAGLRIPPTLVTTSLDIIQKFEKQQVSLITKDIRELVSVGHNHDGYFSSSTEKVELGNNCPERFWYSLFQKLIIKKYELRIFYWVGTFYCAAIFSQADKTSEIDFRNNDLNGNCPNRIVAYNLPDAIKHKLGNLMTRLNLESGSIDMIVDTRGEYFFLEVNPVGQFDFISKLCNFYIEKNIANFFSHGTQTFTTNDCRRQ